MNLKQALIKLNISEFLKEKEKEATQFFIKGLIENGKAFNEAILTIKDFLNEKK